MIKEINQANVALTRARGKLEQLDSALGRAVTTASVDHKLSHAVRALHLADELGIDISESIAKLR